jgi:rod shape determining protein RodA
VAAVAADVLLVGCGLMTILSATYEESEAFSAYFVKQAIWAGAGFVGLLVAMLFDYRRLHRYGYVLYAVAVASLIVVHVAGTHGGGAQRWISLGPVSLQPSEFMKIALVVVLATNLHRWAGGSSLSWGRLVAPIALFALPAFLILRQPDLGTVILLGLVAFSVLLVAGLPLRLVLLAVLVVGPALPFGWQHLKPYQQRRITSFLNPQEDPLGAGLPRPAVENRHRLGHGARQGLPAGDAKQPALPARATHRLRVFGVRRGMGVRRQRPAAACLRRAWCCAAW